MNDDAALEVWKKPLDRFSVYSQIQVQALWDLSEEICKLLDESIKEKMFVGSGANGLNFIYSRFWLWVLGAYEVTRTMSQYSTCFSERHNSEVSAYKKKITVLRIPFAKLELKGNAKQPINAEASIYGIDVEAKDFSFQVSGEVVSMRSLMSEFVRFTKLMEPKDVLHDLRDAPRRVES